jgi:hypothetical protein
MKIIHIANTDFEFELAHSTSSLEQSWQKYPICLQLQYLPLLYANAQDGIVVTHAPDHFFLEQFLKYEWRKKAPLPNFINLCSNVNGYDDCHIWGASRQTYQWMQERKMNVLLPNWQIVQQINSKAFSFQHSPPLPGSALISNLLDLKTWLKNSAGKRVLKTCFGLSGRGHFFINSETAEDKIEAFCQKEWRQKRPLIAEPWVERLFDFSTQWHIDTQKSIKYIGAALFESSLKGVYQATEVGPQSILFAGNEVFLEEHKHIVQPILQKIANLGFFGYLGVDAFVYKDEQSKLHPIVEINGRQTMSLVALWFQKRWFPKRVLRLFFATQQEVSCPLLPSSIQKANGQMLTFDRQLTFMLK